MCCSVLSFEYLCFVHVLSFFFLFECVHVIFVLLNIKKQKTKKKQAKERLLTLTFLKYSKIDDILILALLYFGGPFYAGPKRRKAIF